MKTKITKEFINSGEFSKLITKVPKIIKKHLSNGQYFPTPSEKSNIFLHHTAGMTAAGAWGWWEQTPDQIGVPYIIDRNGDIFECFDPKSWAYHLGVKGQAHDDEKFSIGIEIVAAGHLYGEHKNMFMPLYPNTTSAKEIPADDICVLEKPFVGNINYHAYSDEQIISLCQLLGQIKVEYPQIPFPKEFTTAMLEYDPKNIEAMTKGVLKGIYGHHSVRADKDDLFPQPNLIMALDALMKSYTSKA